MNKYQHTNHFLCHKPIRINHDFPPMNRNLISKFKILKNFNFEYKNLYFPI